MSSNPEVRAMSVEEIDTLKVSAQNMGFDGGAVTDILSKFGPEVLALLVEAARSGFSVQWILDTFNKFGPTVLQFFIDLWHKNVGMAGMASLGMGENPTGVIITGDLIEGLDANLLQTLLEKFLPIILEKYGPQLIQYLMDAIIKALTPPSGVMSAQQKLDASLIQTILTQLLPIIMQKYGPQLIQMLIDAILKAITPQPTPTPGPVVPTPVVSPGVVL